MSDINKAQINKFDIIEKDISLLSEYITTRINYHFSMIDDEIIFEFTDLTNFNDDYSNLIKKHKLNGKERAMFILALSKEISPNILDPFLSKNTLYDTSFTEFGGIQNDNQIGFTPTIQTGLFILCGLKYSSIMENIALFNDESKLFTSNIFKTLESGKSLINSKLNLSNNILSMLFNNNSFNTNYYEEFPAVHLKSTLEWEDLVFSKHTKEHLEELEVWLEHGETLQNEWGMHKVLKKGYKALFYGPPGTGKSITATLLGKKINKPVYRIDLSQIVSKYIGETEKNLEKVFNQADKEDWILFFDEADSLFGKRTSVSNSNDRHANHGTSYLLQRIDECSNMVILASNFKENFDEAYLRRFQSIIYFPLPEKEERLELWKKSFSTKASLEKIDLEEIAQEYEFSGASIMNIVRYASLMAIKNGGNTIENEDLLKAIRREKFKEGKLV